jgi:hypothetical protein
VRAGGTGIPAAVLEERVDAFLASRGYRLSPQPKPVADAAPDGAPETFICEDDVRTAVQDGRKLIIGEKTIVTPAARDLGEAHRVFLQASWSG